MGPRGPSHNNETTVPGTVPTERESGPGSGSFPAGAGVMLAAEEIPSGTGSISRDRPNTLV